MANLDTVGAKIGRDFSRLGKAEFLQRYGHLRPGTYDILSARYDEALDLYFDWSTGCQGELDVPRFALSISQLQQIEKLLKRHGIEHDVLSLMEFIKGGIEGENMQNSYSRAT